MGTHLLVTSEHNEATSTWLSAFRRAQSPESNWPTSVLREPALQLALSSVVRQTAQVKHLRTLSKERTNVASGVKRTSEDIWVALWVGLRRARLLTERAQAASQRQRFLKCAAWRGRSERLKVERKATCDLARRAHFFNFQSSADGRQA